MAYRIHIYFKKSGEYTYMKNKSSIFGLLITLFITAESASNAQSSNQTKNKRQVNRFKQRADIAPLPKDLKNRLTTLFRRPRSYEPLTVFAEADGKSQLFQYYLIDTQDFEPNVFTAAIPGINVGAVATGANFANGGLSTIGAVRLALEPKKGLPTNPDDPGAFIDMFTDLSGLFVINNEAGWYEGWMIRDLTVPQVAPALPDGRSAFGTITQADATALLATGANNVPGNIFTTDGGAVRFPAKSDRFPDVGTNTVGFPISIGAFNSLQQSDVHAYWEFNAGTNWIFPLFELPFTGGVPGTFSGGMQYGASSVVPGSGPRGIQNPSARLGDNPNNPRDPDRTEGDNGTAETRNRFIPSGLANEILLDVFVRPRSFRPDLTDVGERIFAAYAAEVARVDQNNDGAISFVEAALDGTSDGGQSNRRLYLSPRAFNRFAITRELNDGLLAPRFAPSQRAYVASGFAVTLKKPIGASVPRDADDR